MKHALSICALSDLHGQLPNPELIGPVDVVVLCGDTINLEYQRSMLLSEDWFGYEFKLWVNSLQCQKVIMIGGNHDFWMFKKGKQYVKDCFRRLYGDKVVYLEDELYIYNCVRFYGCPWCSGPLNWAFCPGDKYKPITNVLQYYNQIPECDVLLTHQPPKIGNLGVSWYWDQNRKEDWSSTQLFDAVKDKKIIVHFCGHIHSGDHNAIKHRTNYFETVFYNVSQLDEKYEYAYTPRHIYLNKERREVIEYGINTH